MQASRESLQQELSTLRSECSRLQSEVDISKGSEAALLRRLADSEAAALNEADRRRGAEEQLASAVAAKERLGRLAGELLAAGSRLQERFDAVEQRLAATTGVMAVADSAGTMTAAAAPTLVNAAGDQGQEEAASCSGGDGAVGRRRALLQKVACLEVAAQQAAGLLDAMLSSLQCLAADAAPIADSALLARVEGLVGSISDSLLEAAATGRGAPPAAALPALHRSVAAAARRQAAELEGMLGSENAARGELERKLREAAAAAERADRALQLKERAVASLERQLAAANASVASLRFALSHAESQAIAAQAAAAEAAGARDRMRSASAAREAEMKAAAQAAVMTEGELASERERGAAAAEAARQLRGALSEASEAAAGWEARATAAAAEASTAARAAARLEGELAIVQGGLEAAVARAQQSASEASVTKRAAREAEIKAAEAMLQLADEVRAREAAAHRQLEAVGLDGVGLLPAGQGRKEEGGAALQLSERGERRDNGDVVF